MKVIFAGTPEFAAAALASLIKAGHQIALVLTQPDRPAGRGLRLSASPVKQLALQHGLAVAQPQTLRDPGIQAKLAAIMADVMVVAAYGLILPKPVLEIPRLGCINIHASLLPRWRGAAPIPRALLAGDSVTGITIMRMDEGLDTGAILSLESIPIKKDDTAQTLHDKLAALGAECIQRALARLERGELAAKAQDESGACYAEKLTKEEAAVDWTLNADHIGRQVRAFNPQPGAASRLNRTVLKIWQASPVAGVSGVAGEVLQVNRDGILVACGSGALRLEVLQKPGAKKLSAGEFLSGSPVKPGDRFQ